MSSTEGVMWQRNRNGQWAYSGGQEDWSGAARAAQQCPDFRPDDESEWVADVARSCYNCRNRRWTPQSFICLAGAPGKHPEADR